MRSLLAALLSLLFATAASAGAWPVPAGVTQVIVKHETMTSDEVFDGYGLRLASERRIDRELSVFVERGLSERLTLQGKASWQSGEDGLLTYDGRGPVEVGLRYAIVDRPKWKVAVYAGAAAAGEGRNAGYAEPGEGDGDVELRLLAGRDGRLPRLLGGAPYFSEIQIAKLQRAGLPDEIRFDSTSGLRFGKSGRWLLLYQTYAGRTEKRAAEWINGELSLARDVGEGWTVQAGWRESFEGRNTPKASGPVVAVWRRL